MKTNRFAAVLTVAALAASALVFSSCEQAASSAASASYSGTASVYFLAHQGGYVGDFTVTTSANGTVTDVVMNEWQGPGGWATYGDTVTPAFNGTEIVRVPDPMANTSSTDPEIKNHQFYIYDATRLTWLQYNLNTAKTAFVTDLTKTERDFEGTIANPIRARAYAEAAANETVAGKTNLEKLCNVTISGVTVTVVSTAGAGHYGHLNKNNTSATYMPVAAKTIGYKENAARLKEFFIANPTMAYSSMKAPSKAWAGTKWATAWKTTATVPTSTYTETSDTVWGFDNNNDGTVDVFTGATYSDAPMYASELQDAYIAAIAEAKTGNLRSAN